MDGAANLLFDSLGADRDRYIPNLISGDFDSARPDVLEFYKHKVEHWHQKQLNVMAIKAMYIVKSIEREREGGGKRDRNGERGGGIR